MHTCRRSDGAWGRTGGAVGPCPIGGGAGFRRRTLVWVVQIAFGNQELLYQKIAGAGYCFQGRPMD